MTKCTPLRVKIFADGADRDTIARLARNPLIKEFTANPTLMHGAGIVDYAAFATEVLALAGDHPVSFEVLADSLDDMEAEARALSGWGANVYVKVPVISAEGASTGPLVRKLSSLGVKLGVTACLTVDQVRAVVQHLDRETPALVSVFAGRIADPGRRPHASY